MKIIAGLGNPGEKYKNTRHNAGFMAVDFIINDGDGFMMAQRGHEFKSDTFTLTYNGEKVVFMKPQTYMNDSGLALKVISNFFKMDLSQDLLVIHDEVDLPFGALRMTENSSHAGHNGIKSIINELSTQNFHRLRVGVETRANRQDMPTDTFVLQNFTDTELEKLKEQIFPEIKRQVVYFLNRKLPPPV